MSLPHLEPAAAGEPTPPRLPDALFTCLQRLVSERTGLACPERRRPPLEQAALALAGQGTVADLLELLFRAPLTDPLWEELIDRIAIAETYFFRDEATFRVLRQHILPELLARHQAQRRLRLWSAACATGEEPYSLAILLAEMGLGDDWDVSILATDLNRVSCTRAVAGRYRSWALRSTPPALVQRYFTVEDGDYVLRPQLRRAVVVAQLNLTQDTFPALLNRTSRLDLILCRNVAMYLTPEHCRQLWPRLAACLAPGGYLLVAATEAALVTAPTLHHRLLDGVSVFQHEPPATPHPVVLPPVSTVAAPPPPRVEPQVVAASQPERADDGHERFLQALELLDRGATAQALDCLRHTLGLRPELPLVHFLLAQAYRRLGEDQAAARHCHIATRLCAALPSTQPVEWASSITVGGLQRVLQAHDALPAPGEPRHD